MTTPDTRSTTSVTASRSGSRNFSAYSSCVSGAAVSHSLISGRRRKLQVASRSSAVARRITSRSVRSGQSTSSRGRRVSTIRPSKQPRVSDRETAGNVGAGT